MRVLVTGGRDYTERAVVFGALSRLHLANRIELVIHGACVNRDTNELQGADRWAQEWALKNEVPYVGHPALWRVRGSSAGPRRNAEMLQRWNPDVVLALPGGPGTRDMTGKANRAGVRICTVRMTADSLTLVEGVA